MSPSLKKFLLYSAYLHIVFFLLAGFFILNKAESSPQPVKVQLLGSALLMEPSLEAGVIMEMNQPAKEETPEKADILSKWNSKAHGPEKGNKYSATKDALPRERVDPPAPSKEKSKFEIIPTNPAPPPLNVAALPPDKAPDKKGDESAVNVFSETETRRKLEAGATRYMKKGEKREEEKHMAVSSAVTDKPGKPREDPERASGMEKAKGADLDNYAASGGGVIDMGDEAVVSFNTRAFQYAEYFVAIRAAVDRVWEYPEEAILGGWSGAVKVVFTLRRDGRLLEVKALKSSGRKALDDSAQAALLAAGPFAPFPPGLEKQRIHVVAEFRYQPSFHALQ